MKGKIQNIKRKMPIEVRLVPEEYSDYHEKLLNGGIEIPTFEQLKKNYDVINELLLVLSDAEIAIDYEDVRIIFWWKRGFIYDNASTPKLTRSFTDNDSLKMKTAALPHDGLYGCKFEAEGFTKEISDKLFVDIIEYYNDLDKSDGIFENIIEWFEEGAIDLAFKTSAAAEKWNATEFTSYNRQFFGFSIDSLTGDVME